MLGATFKPDIDDARNSAAIRVVEILQSSGAHVEYHDPFAPRISIASSLFGGGDRLRLDSVPLTSDRIAAVDCVAILVSHSAIDYDLVLNHAALVFDAVNATRGRVGKAVVERL